MASGSGSDDFIEEVVNESTIPSPPVSDADARMTAILEQLVRSYEAQVAIQAQHREQMAKSQGAQVAMQEQHREQMAKSHEAQMGMQAQITALLQMQNQMQA